MSTTTNMDSRSSSPETPETSDVPHHVAIHSDLPWCHSLSLTETITPMSHWDGEPPHVSFQKPDNECMLQLNDLIQEHAYDDSVGSGIENSPSNKPNSQSPSDPDLLEQSPLDRSRSSLQRSLNESGLSIPPLSQMHSTPIVPPPALRPSKRGLAVAPRRVLYPPRESCYNLSILTPSIPESGTKSRVETQVRVTVDLARASTSIGEQNQYDRVGSWKWLKLPPGTSTKKRTRREGKIDPAPLDILHLTAIVTCASTPHNRVVSCGSCRNREAKRVARKLAARVRPTRSDSDTPEDGCERPRNVKEDTTSIIQFNCPEILDFSTGSAVLPVRITCYCRHHREKIGFHIHFSMMDHSGRLIGTGTTPPIMITDDHKSTMKSGSILSNPVAEPEVEWSKLPPSASNVAPSKRRVGNVKEQSKTRTKPYDSACRSNPARITREASVTSITSSLNSPCTYPSTGPSTRSPTPSYLPQSSSPTAGNSTPLLPSPTFSADADSVSPFSPGEPIDPSVLNAGSSATVLSPPNGNSTIAATQFRAPCDSPPPILPPTPQPTQLLSTLVPPQPMPFLFFAPGSPSPVGSLPLPKIHRLIPSSGPTHGGIEVTILGENFHPAIQLNCIFGDVVASSTQRWSDNTLLCVLPPRSAPGVVAVWFEGLEKTKESTLPSLFTYTDESDRALMELALQVVGLKMTGKIEDAKNIALRIVGTTGTENSPSNSSVDDLMQVASSSFQDVRPLLFLRSSERHSYEAAVIKLLTLMDVSVEMHVDVSLSAAISHSTRSGQTMLHLAVLLKLTSLTEFLIVHGIDLDARDRNGFTALHFAVLVQSKECIKLLLAAGADIEIVNILGKTAHDIAPVGFFTNIIGQHLSSGPASSGDDTEEDGESHWGDVETDEEVVVVVKKSRGLRRRLRRPLDTHQQLDNGNSHSPQRQQSLNKVEDAATPKLGKATDEKQAASFVEMIQRTLAQFPATQGIIPNIPHMPQLPLPHLPEMPAVPWAALPQIPMVFPVFVPMPGWPSFLSDKQKDPRDDGSTGAGDTQPTGQSTTQDIRATWEKWMALAMTTATLRPPPTEEAPPMYTPRETGETNIQRSPTNQVDSLEVSTMPTVHSLNTTERPARRMGYEIDSKPTPDAYAYGYIPVNAHTQRAKKHDRMLVLFWLPILLLSLLWAFSNGIRFAVNTLKTSLTLKVGIRT